MLKHRLIPVLLLKNGLLVRSEVFNIHQIIGNPIAEVQRFNEWNVDELIYLDITRGGTYDMRRDDHALKGLSDPYSILEAVAKNCFMPLTWGGRIRTVSDMRECFRRGADKITINSAALESPSIVGDAASRFGSQAIVVSIDVREIAGGQWDVVSCCGTKPTGRDPISWAREVQDRGAGEILIQSIDRDGTATGYDVDLLSSLTESVSIPVIACSGVGTFEDYAAGIQAGASAVAAANIWHFKELADRQGKRALARAGICVRLPRTNKRKKTL